MNSRIALSGLSILASLALVTTGAYAAFSSTNSNNGNTFGSGSLTLNINGSATSSPIFTLSGKAPGDVAQGVLDLQNVGTISANSVKITTIDTAGSNLGDVLTLDLYKDVDDSGTINTGDTLVGSAHLSDPAWTNLVLAGVTLPAAGHQKLIAKITFDAGADNSHQSQSLTFNFNFQADQ